MKKKGYTLAEVLITIGIIGIISAIIMPAIGNAKPDKTKMMYLKVYDSLTTTVMNFVNDSSIYSPTYKVTIGGNDTYFNVDNCPLVNFGKPINTSFNAVEENEYKLANLLKYALEDYGTAPTMCSSGSKNCSFKMKDNITLTITPSPDINSTLWKATSSTASVTFYNTLQMTIDGKNFSFYITGNGEIVPIDIQGQAYIKYRKKATGKDSTTGFTAKTLADINNGTYTVGVSGDIIKL